MGHHSHLATDDPPTAHLTTQRWSALTTRHRAACNGSQLPLNGRSDASCGCGCLGILQYAPDKKELKVPHTHLAPTIPLSLPSNLFKFLFDSRPRNLLCHTHQTYPCFVLMIKSAFERKGLPCSHRLCASQRPAFTKGIQMVFGKHFLALGMEDYLPCPCPSLACTSTQPESVSPTSSCSARASRQLKLTHR